MRNNKSENVQLTSADQRKWVEWFIWLEFLNILWTANAKIENLQCNINSLQRAICIMFHEKKCKFPTINISKLNFWLVICFAKNFIWTTLKAIFSIFRFFLFFATSDFRFSNSCISTKYCPILTIDLYDWFCGPGSHIVKSVSNSRFFRWRKSLSINKLHCSISIYILWIQFWIEFTVVLKYPFVNNQLFTV